VVRRVVRVAQAQAKHRSAEVALKRFVLKPRKLWGDYGSVLLSGYCCRGEDGPLLLHRAGPFLPPVSFPWDLVGGWHMVVSDEFRGQLERAFPELHFRAAAKNRIVRLDWHTWDRTAAEPRRYPGSGEPEDYIWDKPHDQRAAEQMPPAWEVLAPVVPLTYEQHESAEDEVVTPLRAVLQRGQQYPRWFSSADEFGDAVVDSAVRDWLRATVGEWLAFEPLRWRFA
jgi:hypothetical protein